MRIVLDKSAHTRQARKRTAGLVSVENTEFSHTQGQFTITPEKRNPIRHRSIGSMEGLPVSRVEDQSVAGTVHRLERKGIVLDREREHVILVVCPVARLFPEFGVEHVG